MSRIIAHLLILLVLFTHSTMAMDVHIPHDVDHPADHMSDVPSDGISVISSTDIEQTLCLDAGGHCSHHQAHTAGLISVNYLSDAKVQPVLFSILNASVFTLKQAPPLRPPKA